MDSNYINALLGILLSAVLTENYILVKFYGIFAATIIGLIVGAVLEFSLSLAVVVFVMLAVAAFVLIIVWRRKFVFGKTGWIVYGVSLGAGLVLAVITALVIW